MIPTLYINSTSIKLQKSKMKSVALKKKKKKRTKQASSPKGTKCALQKFRDMETNSVSMWIVSNLMNVEVNFTAF